MARSGRKWVSHPSDSPALSAIRADIRRELDNRGMSQADLARATQMSQKHVSQLLTGKIRGTVSALEKLAGAVGLVIITQEKENQP